MKKNHYINKNKCMILFFILLFILPALASSEEIYQFERMWPTLQQPWYFSHPQGIAIDASGNVYLVDYMNHCIKKFSSDGYFITTWGTYGYGDGQFASPSAIAIDESGNVYVGDHRLKYDPSLGTNVDERRIQKFTSDGKFITTWGSEGSDNGQFKLPRGIALDDKGNVYVIDWSSNCIQKFTSEGKFITRWGSEGDSDGEFNGPFDIAIDGSGNVYVADTGNRRIQKFTSDGRFIAKWCSYGSRDGQLQWPWGIDIAKNGNIYVADVMNNRIQKFTANGEFITKWGSEGDGNGEFDKPFGVTIDGSENVYVVDTGNNRIQKFTSDGTFITTWGSEGDGDGEFNGPFGIALDEIGDVYVADTDNSRIQKFTADGKFITTWGSKGEGDGEFSHPHGITVDEIGDIYVADTDNSRIQKFTADGKFITTWGSEGYDNGEFSRPCGIAVDGNGFVYVADYTERVGWHSEYGTIRYFLIQRFTSDGQFITKWGEQGHNPDQVYLPKGLAVNPINGHIYISNFHSIKVFKKTSIPSKSKAIIVAGGGPFPGNNIWDATQMCANFAYRALISQGFTKETIYYLSSDTDLDLDSNGMLDDVDGDATNSNLNQAMTIWAKDTDSLMIYLVDHGGDGTFRMSSTEILSASDLDIWLDTIQTTIPGKVTVIYDACGSGSFIFALRPPSGKGRIVITSTSPDESAYFITQGSISFSNYFWTQIFNGLNVKKAYELAKDAINNTTNLQNPLLDANGDGSSNEAADFIIAQDTYIGNGTVIHGGAPVIGSVSEAQIISNTASAILSAYNVTDNDGIAHVWAVIRPPDYRQGLSDNPVQGLPSFDLKSVSNDQYEETYDGFNIEGTYHIAIYAMDRIGNTSIPKVTTITVDNPLTRKAIIVAGGSQSDKLWPAIEKSATLVYEALTFQGYSNDDIYLMSPVTFSTGVDGTAIQSNLMYAIETWARQNIQDLVVYMVGKGDHGIFRINDTEALSASDLDSWLDNLQADMPGKVTVIYDACCSGSFLSLLIPPDDKERILISSTGKNQPAYFLSGGDISFSKFFWNRILNGMDVQAAFLHAKNAIAFLCKNQTPQLDDTGNGVGNEKSDGKLAKNYIIGVGIMLAGDDPMIGSICPGLTLSGSSYATIRVEDVTTTGTIERIFALINSPQYVRDVPGQSVTDLPTVELVDKGDGRYEGTYSDFSIYGTYTIAVYAKDTEGNLSVPKETHVFRMDGPDIYEDDDIFSNSSVIILNDQEAQAHNFHDTGDKDWVQFYGISEVIYTIKISNAGTYCDAVIELYNENGTIMLAFSDDRSVGEDELLDWKCEQDGVYYVRIKNSDPSLFGEGTEYNLVLYHPIGELWGTITGNVRDTNTGGPIEGVLIQTDGKAAAISLPNGAYFMVHPVGTFTVTAKASGYRWLTYAVLINEGEIIARNFDLTEDVSRPTAHEPIGNNSVENINRAPVLDKIGTKTIEEGEVLEFTITAMDLDGDSLTFSASGLPDGAHFDAETQMFSWRSDLGDTGNYEVIFTVTDCGIPSKNDTQTVTITVTPAPKPLINNPPDQPLLSFPRDGEITISLSPELKTGNFNDPDSDDTHDKTQWQISLNNDFTDLVLDVTSSEYFTLFSVPETLLNNDTLYHWRVRFYDNNNGISEWSPPYSFRTVAVSAEDTNMNGVLDDQEVDVSGEDSCFITSIAYLSFKSLFY
ncbi:MAG: 6-bladed beta-propeller [bacterium]